MRNGETGAYPAFLSTPPSSERVSTRLVSDLCFLASLLFRFPTPAAGSVGTIAHLRQDAAATQTVDSLTLARVRLQLRRAGGSGELLSILNSGFA
jgi:hypothetical protein